MALIESFERFGAVLLNYTSKKIHDLYPINIILNINTLKKIFFFVSILSIKRKSNRDELILEHFY
jgi:hypothetical protein